MQLESVEPAHSALANFSYASKGFVAADALVVTYPKNGRINKGDAGAFAPAAVMEKKHKGHCAAVAELYKAVVGDKVGEAVFEMNAGVLGVEELEVSESAGMKSNEHGNDFRIAQRCFPVAGFGSIRMVEEQLMDGVFEKQAEIIYGNENFGYFVSE